MRATRPLDKVGPGESGTRSSKPVGGEGSTSAKAVFQPYWGKPTVRDEWRGLGKHGRYYVACASALLDPPMYRLWPSLEAPNFPDTFSVLRIPALRLLRFPVVAGGFDALVVRIQLRLEQNQRGQAAGDVGDFAGFIGGE